MNEIAFFYYENNIYWHGIIMAAAVLAMVICTFALRIMQKGNAKGIGFTAVIALPMAMLLSRFTYCFFVIESFDDIKNEMLSPNGGNSLLGAFIGVVLAVLIARVCKMIDSAAEVFDCIAPAAAMGIGLGRLSAIFSSDDRGMEISGDVGMDIITCTEGTGENKVVAVFAYEAICAGIMFVALTAIFVWIYLLKGKEKGARSGDAALMFLAGFGVTQGVLESMRSDSITIVGLRFVRVLQITALICIIIAAVTFSVRAVKRNKLSHEIIISWLIELVLLGIQVYIEFKITADVQIKMHMIMAACMFEILIIILWQYNMSRGKMLITKGKTMTVEENAG